MGERIRPFSCGSEYVDWKCRNCNRCVKEWTEEHQWLCAIECAIDYAYMDDGTVTAEIGSRLKFDGLWVVPDCPERELTPDVQGVQK